MSNSQKNNQMERELNKSNEPSATGPGNKIGSVTPRQNPNVQTEQSIEQKQFATNPPPANAVEAIDNEAEYVPLPSRGYLYKGQFKGLDQLKVRKLNWTDEDILTTKSYYDNGTLFLELLRNTIVDSNGFQASDLLPVDRDAILYWLRIGAFGREYQMPWTYEYVDPNNPGRVIKGKAPIKWDLGLLEAPDYNPKYKDELIEKGYVTITLPDAKIDVRVSIASIGREHKVQKKLEKRRERERGTKDFKATARLISSLAGVPTETGQYVSDVDRIYQWLQESKLSIRDSREITKVAREINLAFDLRTNFYDPKTQYTEEEVRMPMSIYFFWPDFEQI